MTLIKALRWCRRLLYDQYVNRADTYLLPLAEQIPQMITMMQMQMNQQQSKINRMGSKSPSQRFIFPQTWVNPQ